jgi:hypothetical protein
MIFALPEQTKVSTEKTVPNVLTLKTMRQELMFVYTVSTEVVRARETTVYFTIHLVATLLL